MNQANWNENLGLNMPPEKVAFLNAMLEEMGGKNKNEMMPFLLSVMSRANSKGIQFTDQETDFIIGKLKANMSPAERKKVDMLRQMTRMFGRSGKGTAT
ncbi:MAG: hypothetical protein ACLU6W_03645 [Lachnospiraceae bacterium]